MIYNFSIWLLEASIGILILAAVYRFILKDLTFFRLNRIVLVAGFLCCILVPLLPFPWWNFHLADHTDSYFKLMIPADQPVSAAMVTGGEVHEPAGLRMSFIEFGGYLLILVYVTGLLRKAFLLLCELNTLFQLRKKSTLVVQEDNLRIVVQNALPTCSFGNTIFLHGCTEQLTSTEREYILIHEKTHIRQKHTLDIVLYELGSIVFWFHPVMNYLSDTLKELHEYLVDDHVTAQMNSVAQYGLLLIKLATRKSHRINTINSFSDTSTFNRIKMLTKPKSKSMQKLKFLATIPAGMMLVAACSFMQPNEDSKIDRPSEIGKSNSAVENALRIGKITWTGNSKFSAAELTDMLAVKPGDSYDSTKLYDRIYSYEGIAARYMNDGYLFFNVSVSDSAVHDKVNLTFNLNEGQKARIGKVIVKGNQKIKTVEILNLIDIKAGEPFNRSKLILAQKALAESGYFDAKNVNINPIPDHASFADHAIGKVDFEFVVKEI